MRLVSRKMILPTLLAVLVIVSSVVYSHCQIPCGIYDDRARVEMLAEHITTIEKSVAAINELTAQAKPDQNQLIRWINNKDTHADAAAEIITYYFMAQRIKPVDTNAGKAYDEYIKRLTSLHRALVMFMKTKQSADPALTDGLRGLLVEFEKQYFKTGS